MEDFIDTKTIGRRQDLGVFYRINGAIYIQKMDVLMEEKNLYGPKAYAYIMDKVHSVDIDDAFDFMVAEAAMEFEGDK